MINKAQAFAAASLMIAAGAFSATSASAANPKPASSGLDVRVFATGTATMYGPDDIARLGSDVFVAWQNGVGSTGSPSGTGNTASTVVEYNLGGQVLGQWSLTGKVDGMGADPLHQRVVATVNEDGNSSLYTVTPSATPAVVHYQYAPSGPLPHGGGTDSVRVVGSNLFISASAPTATGGPAVYEVTLSGTTATLRPVFFDNSSAVVANTNASDYGQSVALALTDPDSSEVVPSSSPRFGGDFVLGSQGDGEQIYVSDPLLSRPRLAVLRLSQSVDDTAYITDSSGTLLITDGADNEVFEVTGNLPMGAALTAVTPGDANQPVNAPNYLGRIDLSTGNVTSVITTIQAKGLLYIP